MITQEQIQKWKTKHSIVEDFIYVSAEQYGLPGLMAVSVTEIMDKIEAERGGKI